ncbi:hypothetical protein AXK60_24740 [Tsukamurella pseudospumae]|uniref:Uncharacterized protein n=1 Tax=Tsukamurella pseudospumae TaxID=239498 RepID=A0A138AMI3_9ACTN|nr:hypothetical protein AXK60_24740 [Tsukamurella pseudospumae]
MRYLRLGGFDTPSAISFSVPFDPTWHTSDTVIVLRSHVAGSWMVTMPSQMANTPMIRQMGVAMSSLTDRSGDSPDECLPMSES